MGGHAGLLKFFFRRDLGMTSEARKKAQDSKESIRELVNEESVKRMLRKYGIHTDDNGGGRNDARDN